MGERELPPSWDGSVVLDIGGDVGALVLHVPSDMLGREIDLVADRVDLPHTHSAVRQRRLEAGDSYAAVYPQLVAGAYTVSDSGQRVDIVAGRVSELNFCLNKTT